MEVAVYLSDMKPEFKEAYEKGTLILRKVRYHMFKPEVQEAIRNAGSATFRVRDLYERINVPK